MPLLLSPIEVVPLFAGERAALLDLLAGLDSDGWRAPTVCDGWSVHDVALHLLGDTIGFVSSWRDGHRNPSFADGLDVETWDGLLSAIDRQNAEWVRATRRISPPLLIELLRITGQSFVDVVTSLDPAQPAGPVDWAGPGPAPAWLHLAREYSEFWVHQQQIRDAVGRPGLTDRRWLHPILDAFALAVPRALDATTSAPGATVRLVVTGDAGGTWAFARTDVGWSPVEQSATPAPGAEVTGVVATGSPGAIVTMDADTCWRLFTKGITPADAEADRRSTRSGDPPLAAAVFGAVAILA